MCQNKIVMYFTGVLLALGSIYLAILGWNGFKEHAYIGISPKTPHSISIVGEGKVSATPDIAEIQLGYSVEKKTVAEAQQDNSLKMNAMIDKLKKDFKIDAKDIKTANYYITPQYDWANNRQALRGYTVSQNLNVKVRQMDKVSAILDAAGSIGLNQVGNLTFSIDNPEKLKQEARAMAISQAKDKAEALSKIVGVKLGRIISFSESANQPQPPMYASYKVMDSAVGSGAAPAVEAGTNEITIMATVEYEIL
jgi:uncharacterized protein